MNRIQKLKIVLYLTILFLAGVGTGVFISFQVARHIMPSEARITERCSRELESKLHLSPEQMQKIRPVISETFGEFRAALSGDALSILSRFHARISDDLTPEQRVKFEALEKEQRGFIERTFGGQTEPQPGRSGTN